MKMFITTSMLLLYGRLSLLWRQLWKKVVFINLKRCWGWGLYK